MIIPVAGMDPSFTHWGIAKANLCLDSGELSTPQLTIIEPEKLNTKQIRVNSSDMFRSEQLAEEVLRVAQSCKVMFVEVPVGSQSARAMTSYGVCVGILGMLRSMGHQIIEVTASEVKYHLTGNKNATKQNMIDEAVKLYPNSNWPTRKLKGKVEITSKAEHAADAIAAIHAGVHTPAFQTLMRLLEKV